MSRDRHKEPYAVTGVTAPNEIDKNVMVIS